jgi:hypothetical protein
LSPPRFIDSIRKLDLRIKRILHYYYTIRYLAGRYIRIEVILEDDDSYRFSCTVLIDIRRAIMTSESEYEKPGPKDYVMERYKYVLLVRERNHTILRGSKVSF